jgi:hypothetical protein
LLNPEVAAIDCEHCKLFAYDLKTGKPYLNGNQFIPRSGKPPCATDDKACLKVKPGASDLTPTNRHVLKHYLECRAVGQFPDDAIVRQNAAVLDGLYREADSYRTRQALDGAMSGMTKILVMMLKRR